MKNILTIISLFCVSILFAQAPQKFNYQAVARNAQGVVIANQTIKIRTSILDGTANGNSQYSETHSATTSQLGLFNLSIGAGTIVSGKFSEVTWSNGDKYLKIEMDPTGGNNFTVIGTSQLLSVPYALNAGNGSQWKNYNNGIFYDQGSVGIGIEPNAANLASQSPLAEGPAKFHVNGQMVIGGNNPVGGAINNLPFNYGDQNAAIWISPYNNPADVSKPYSDYAVIYADWDSTLTQGSSSGYGDRMTLNIITGDNTYPSYNGIDSDNDSDMIFLGSKSYRGSYTKGITIRDGSLGIDTKPKARLHVANGDIFIEDLQSGIIMKSPNGQCWRMTVSNTGQAIFTSITCP